MAKSSGYLRYFILIFTALNIFLSSGFVPVQGAMKTSSLPNQIVMPRIKGPVNLDGLSDETAWEGIEPLPFVIFEPNFGKEPTERTEVMVAYDDHFLYMAGRLYDKEPEKIQSNSKQRDSMNPSCEWFGIIIDSFNDKENALAFFTTPSGLRWDAAVFNDAQGESPINVTWNTFWDVATMRNQRGWFAEFRIPLSSLRFQDKGGQVVLGIIIWRSITRKNEWVIFPDIPPNWGFWSKFKPSQAQEFVLENVYSRRPLYVAPYVLGGIGHSSELNPERKTYQSVEDLVNEAGLDVKHGLTSNLVLDLTLNPDFAQVEADDQQVNLTRFSLFFPEKRLFFQERSSIFDFQFESSEQNCLFYSRQIGIHEDQLVRIYGGARMVGRIGPWDVGFLSMQTASGESFPYENFGIFRLRRQVFNPYSYLGGMFTSRIGLDGIYNFAYGLDGIIRVFDDDYLTLKWAQTFSSTADNNPFSLAPARFYLNWLRRSNKGFGYGLSLSRAGIDYDPGAGFELRENYFRSAWGLWLGWLPGENSLLFSHILMFNGSIFIRNSDGGVESLEVGPGWIFNTKTGYSGEIASTLYYEDILETFSLSDQAEVPRGKYTFFGLTAEFSTPQGKSLFTSVTLDTGAFYDGRRISFGLSPNWSLFSGLELSGDYQFNRVTFSSRRQSFTAHIARLRALFMLNTKFSASVFLQYNSAAHIVIGNIRLRYNPREGIDLYIVYNEAWNTHRTREIPHLPLIGSRAIMVKYSYTFHL